MKAWAEQTRAHHAVNGLNKKRTSETLQLNLFECILGWISHCVNCSVLVLHGVMGDQYGVDAKIERLMPFLESWEEQAQALSLD